MQRAEMSLRESMESVVTCGEALQTTLPSP